MMLDFNFVWRPFRALYILFLAGAVYFVAGIWPALICLLAYVDIVIEDDNNA